MQAALHGVADQVKDVLALERVTAGQNEDRWPKVSNVTNKLLCLRRVQLIRIMEWLRTRPAVDTCQIAGLRRLPDDDEWTLVQIVTSLLRGLNVCLLGHHVSKVALGDLSGCGLRHIGT